MDREWLNITRPGDVAGYAYEILALHKIGVSTRLVARTFQTNTSNIRQIRSRGATTPDFLPTPRITPLLKQYGSDEAHWAKMRAASEPDYPTGVRDHHMDLAIEMASISDQFRESSKFDEAIENAQHYRMFAANASSPSALWLQAATHTLAGMPKIVTGDYKGASDSGKRAMLAAVKAFDNSFGDKYYLEAYTFAGFCALTAALYLRDIKEGIEVHDEAEAAAIYSTGHSMSELLTLKAQLLARGHEVAAAIDCLNKARLQAVEDGEYPDDLEVRYGIDLSLARFEGKLDRLFQLVKNAELDSGIGSNIHWKAILMSVNGAFMTDDAAATRDAMTMLADAQQLSHATTQMQRDYFLLSITPQLGLDLSKRREWLRTI